jgi:hypothetical protein
MKNDNKEISQVTQDNVITHNSKKVQRTMTA